VPSDEDSWTKTSADFELIDNMITSKGVIIATYEPR
jgi:hypothetical protein